MLASEALEPHSSYEVGGPQVTLAIKTIETLWGCVMSSCVDAMRCNPTWAFLYSLCLSNLGTA
eukprot:4249727-Amphidinium_carterae.2